MEKTGEWDSGTFSAKFCRKAEIVMEKQLKFLRFECVGWGKHRVGTSTRLELEL